MLARGIGILALIALGAALGALTGCGPGEAGDFSTIDFTPDETRTGPVGDEFNTDGFAIVRVLRQPKQLSAFGYASLYDDTREVGRMDEGQKTLPADKRGERIVFSWQYKGTPGAAATARILLYRHHDDEPVVVEEQYPSLERGRHRIAYSNRGAQFSTKGAVNRWQIQIISGGKVVAQKQSSLWASAAAAQPAAE